MILDQKKLSEASGFTRPSDIRRWLKKPKNRAIFQECDPGKDGCVSAILRVRPAGTQNEPDFASLD